MTGAWTYQAFKHGHLTAHEFRWTSNSSGAATLNLRELHAQPIGVLHRVVFIPSATSGKVPSANYNVYLQDDTADIDVLLNLGVTQSATVTRISIPTLTVGTATDKKEQPRLHAGGHYRFSVTSAGNTKQGTVVLWTY